MGKVKFFFLHFHTRSRIYHAGENLSGYVVVDLKEAAQVQGKICSMCINNFITLIPQLCGFICSESSGILSVLIIIGSPKLYRYKIILPLLHSKF